MQTAGILFVFVLFRVLNGEISDPNGYVVYCPCMGRFGNQADHFLGSLAFAKALNRTLILPPWVEYRAGRVKSTQVPFDQYFETEPLMAYHRVITMERFMRELAPSIWPPTQRTVFCYGPRHGAKSDDCNAKDGNPFESFWDTFAIDFDRSEFFGGRLTFESSNGHMEQWNKIYPPDQYPVLAFAGAPAGFPVSESNLKLHKYLKWSRQIADQATDFIENVLPFGAFIAIHLRNDLDWANVCVHVSESRQLFSSAQCLGYRLEHGRLTQEICQPSEQTILNQIYESAKAIGAKSVFVASDRHHMLDEINKKLKNLGIKAYRRHPDEPLVSLAIMGRADYFIGNCVSSFTAFVKRERDVHDRPSGFWGVDDERDERDEL